MQEVRRKVVEEHMQLHDVHALHIPVSLFNLRVQVERIGKPLAEQLNR